MLDRIAELLDTYDAPDPTERRHRDAMLDLLGAPGDTTSRDHFDPGHFTASGFVLSPDRGSLLLILHRRLGRWMQPGGHIDPDDADPVAAARREIAEETGIVALDGGALFDLDVHPIPSRAAGEPAHHHFDLRFLFTSASRDVSPSGEVAGARWVRVGDVAGVTDDASTVRAAQKLGGRRSLS